MNIKLLNMAFALVFVDCDINKWVNAYMYEWTNERDSGELPVQLPLLDGTRSSIYVLSDKYNPDGDRADYELQAQDLKISVQYLLINNHFLEGYVNWEKVPNSIPELLYSYSARKKSEYKMNPKHYIQYRHTIEQAIHAAHLCTPEDLSRYPESWDYVEED